MADTPCSAAGGQPIAIVGLACRFPDADDPPALLDLVLTGRRAFRRLPPCRLDIAEYYSPDPATPDATYSTRAALIEGWRFDRAAFGVSAADYASADPAHWLALETVARALAAAGFAGGRGLARNRVGVVIGNTLTGDTSRATALRLRWPYVRRVLADAMIASGLSREQGMPVLRQAAARYLAPFPEVTAATLAGSIPASIAARICGYFGFRGGGHAVDGAASSSLLAVASACTALAAGDLDVALAGGVDVSLDPLELVGLAKAGLLAAADVRVYDENPTGFLPGEGCGVVVLMRAADARAADLPVYAEIAGWGMSSTGQPGLAAPDHASQLLALRRAYLQAGIEPADVQLIEGHGAATAASDLAELTALAELRHGARRAAVLGSIAANIGHAKAAGGAAGLIKTVLAMGSEARPPATGVGTPHPLLRGKDSGLQLSAEAAPWPDGPRIAAVSAMDPAGVNVHMVLSSEPVQASRHDRGFRVLARVRRTPADALTAATPAAAQLPGAANRAFAYLLHAQDRATLAATLTRIADIASWLSDAEMHDLACKLTRDAGGQGPVRVGIVASRQEQLGRLAREAIALLPDLAADRLVIRPGIVAADGASGRVTLLLSGRDSATVAAAQAGREASAQHGAVAGRGETAGTGGTAGCGETAGSGGTAERGVPAAEHQASPTAGQPHGSATGGQPPAPGLPLLAWPVLGWLDRLGVRAAAAVGRGLGEIAGLAWAGCLTEAQATRLASRCSEILDGPGNTVAALADRSAQLRALLTQFVFSAPRRRLISAATGRALTSADDVVEALCAQLGVKDRLYEALGGGAARADLLVETGPGQALCAAAARYCDVPAVSLASGVDDLTGRDAGPGDGRAAARAAAALFAAGALGMPRALYLRESARPIDIWRERIFIVSPCQAQRSPAARTVEPASGPAARTAGQAPHGARSLGAVMPAAAGRTSAAGPATGPGTTEGPAPTEGLTTTEGPVTTEGRMAEVPSSIDGPQQAPAQVGHAEQDAGPADPGPRLADGGAIGARPGQARAAQPVQPAPGQGGPAGARPAGARPAGARPAGARPARP